MEDFVVNDKSDSMWKELEFLQCELHGGENQNNSLNVACRLAEI
jgi:hypothetical protein